MPTAFKPKKGRTGKAGPVKFNEAHEIGRIGEYFCPDKGGSVYRGSEKPSVIKNSSLPKKGSA